ncbi:uncharacterized protein LOC121886123 [Thunnus maccoyii]|uniref:uncharacterized protein LOC121886123 n=1 Tax=Thunnus maccoyii TaxID=8240 RepID=UPI001C4B6449|nr:uncharacterized protein LOC121886123 [Thunnus maccoyii]
MEARPVGSVAKWATGPETVLLQCRRNGMVDKEWHVLHLAMYYDVGMVLQGMDVSCCDTKLATGQKVNCEKGVILHPFHCTFSAHRTIQLADQFPLVVHNFVMDSFESKENHPALEGVPKQLWATHKYDVGLIKDATPLVVVPKSDYRPNKRQYPLRPDAEEGMTPIIEQLLNDKIIVPAPTSPCNTPLLPIKKADGKSWRPVHDLRAVNEAVFARAAVVPNPATILSSVPGESSSSIASEGRRNNPSFPARRLGFGEGSEETTLAFSAVERSIPGPADYTNGSKSQGEDNLDPCVPL